jgi:hypothetical protein
VANIFENIKQAQTQIASVSLAALNRQIVLPNTVYRSAENDYNGRSGDVVTVRKPATLTARTLADRNQAITYDDVQENGVPVAIDSVIYHGARIEDEVAEFDVENFMAQVVIPQVVACAIQAENVLAAEMDTLASDLAIAANGSDAIEQIIQARKALNEANVPANNRYLVVSPDVEAFLVSDERLMRVDASGSNSALREAVIGRLFGFEVLWSNAIAAGTAVAYHQDAFAFVSRAPRVPQGVSAGSSQTYGGLGVRWTMDYDSDYIRDRSLLLTFAGAAVLDADRIVKLTTTGVSS